MLQSRRTGYIVSQLLAPAYHGRYFTSAPCFTLAELSASTITLRLATVATPLPHRVSLSPRWAHDSQLHTPAHHGRYFTSAPCLTLAELSALTMTLRLATAATPLPHRTSLSPSWADRVTITCSGSPRPLPHLPTVLHSRRAERIDSYAPPRHSRYITIAPCLTLAELSTSILNNMLRFTTVATLPLHRASLSPS